MSDREDEYRALAERLVGPGLGERSGVCFFCAALGEKSEQTVYPTKWVKSFLCRDHYVDLGRPHPAIPMKDVSQ